MNSTDKPPQAQGLPVTIHAQYVRDFSFENPGAPQTLQISGAPEMDINLGMDARKLPPTAGQSEMFYEVVLSVRAQANRDKNVLFIAELEYAALVSLGAAVPEDKHHPLLLIEIPRLLFPFVRQVLSDMTVQGGFPPLLLNPMDFSTLYQQRFAEKRAG